MAIWLPHPATWRMRPRYTQYSTDFTTTRLLDMAQKQIVTKKFNNCEITKLINKPQQGDQVWHKRLKVMWRVGLLWSRCWLTSKFNNWYLGEK